jgi:hypothetical protein
MAPQTRKRKRPLIEKWSDLNIWVEDREDGSPAITTWVHFSAEDEAYMGRWYKAPQDLTLDECAAGLIRQDDRDIYPETSAAGPVTVAAQGRDDDAAFMKHSGFRRYNEKELHDGAEYKDGWGPKDQLLEEVLVLEKLSKMPHPYIVRYLRLSNPPRAYHGRGAGTPELDSFHLRNQVAGRVCAAQQGGLPGGRRVGRQVSALAGMAHNDINPRNIMVREDDNHDSWPVLIDFDSCATFGGRLLSAGTPGFVDTDDPDMGVSHKKHDEFALSRLREWWDKQLEGVPGVDQDSKDSKDKKDNKDSEDSKNRKD